MTSSLAGSVEYGPLIYGPPLVCAIEVLLDAHSLASALIVQDGIPKTPEWAEEKTAVPSRTIKQLAREWASKRTSIAHTNGGPYIRGPYSTEPARLEVILLGMQGLGKPGCHQLSMHEWSARQTLGGRTWDPNPMPGPMVYPNVAAASGAPSYMERSSEDFIPKLLIPDAILHPPISWYGTTLARELIENQFVEYTHPAEGCSEIHMVWTDSPSWMSCWNDSNSMAEALRHPKIEFVLAQHPWLENDCLFADIILPSTTKFETDDIGVDGLTGEYKSIFLDGKCIEPIGESKSEYEIVSAIAEKLGLLEQYTGGESVEQKIRRGFETSGVQDLVTWEEFSKK